MHPNFIDFILSLLQITWFVFYISAPVFLAILCIHSSMYNRWKENFSKEGLIYHIKDLIRFMFIGLLIIIGFSKIKSWFKND